MITREKPFRTFGRKERKTEIAVKVIRRTDALPPHPTTPRHNSKYSKIIRTIRTYLFSISRKVSKNKDNLKSFDIIFNFNFFYRQAIKDKKIFDNIYFNFSVYI